MLPNQQFNRVIWVGAHKKLTARVLMWTEEWGTRVRPKWKRICDRTSEFSNSIELHWIALDCSAVQCRACRDEDEYMYIV